MAGKQTENQLLFSAVSSPFDSFSSVLLPPSESPAKKEETNAAENVPSTISLQPHLVPSKPSSVKENPTPAPPKSFDIKPPIGPSSSVLTSPPLAPPILPTALSGSSFHRPGSKYVVPPEIGSARAISQPHIPPVPPLSAVSPPTFMMPDPSKVPEPTPPAPSNTFPTADFSITTGLPQSFDAMASNPPVQNTVYYPVLHHWFFYDIKQTVSSWTPFSFTDSLNLEQAFRTNQTEPIATDGGRYDVSVLERKRTPIFWDTPPSDIRRCSWFHRGVSESLPVPYDEADSEKLEMEYKDALESGQWHRQIQLSAGETVILNSPYSMQHYPTPDVLDFPNSPGSVANPRTVRRGADDFTIPDGPSEQIDHLLFLIHGIGSACDLSFRSVEECVDDFRSIGEDLIGTHFKEALEMGKIGRIEILPISWHKALHGDETGLDSKLKLITLRSIPKLREFTNDTLLDILFYTSPLYCQHIMDTVATEMERLLKLFRKRHPEFQGNISLGGHSLGSVIVFDLLMHQTPPGGSKKSSTTSKPGLDVAEAVEECLVGSAPTLADSPGTSKVDFQMGDAGTGQPVVTYPKLSFEPEALFMMGSPLGMFVTVRGINSLGPNFQLPTCKKVFNIFHPFDPVAYRIETLIDPTLTELRPVLVPHHKGRKRMHLELKDTIERVSSDLKNKVMESIQATWKKVYSMYTGTSSNDYAEEQMNEALENEMDKLSVAPIELEAISDIQIGCLNSGRRIDYVLQEKPYESFTEYIFALQAHLTYWQSEDTLLMIINELYNAQNIFSDSHLQKVANASSKVATSTINTTASVPAPIPSEPMSAPAPVPLQPTPSIAHNSSPSLPPLSVGSDKPRVLGGRPVFDPSSSPAQMGMDPTAIPTGASKVGPPPVIPKMSFKRKQ